MTLERVIQFIGNLVGKGFTGRIILDLHKGCVSNRVKIEVVEIVE